jgi:hypothetical protein
MKWVEYRIQWRAVDNTAMNPGDPITRREFCCNVKQNMTMVYDI